MWGFNTTQFLILASQKYNFILWAELAKTIMWNNTSSECGKGLNCPFHSGKFIQLLVQHISIHLV